MRSPGRIFTLTSIAVVVIAAVALSTWWLLGSGDLSTRGSDLERRLARLDTVQGRLSITLQGATLEQKLWVQRPLYLRTETERGPSGFTGTIVVLNDKEGWVYSRALNMATLVERSGMSGFGAEATGTGSLLERMPATIVAALRGGAAAHATRGEQRLGRSVTRYEIDMPADDPTFPPGVLQVWLDDQYAYPLAWRDSQGRELRFTEITFNRPIDPATFVFFPPPGAAVHRVPATP